MKTPLKVGERVSLALALWLVFVHPLFSMPWNCERTLCCQVREACSLLSSGLWECEFALLPQASRGYGLVVTHRPLLLEKLPVPCMGNAPSVWISWVLIVPKSVCDILPMECLSPNRQQNVIPVFRAKHHFREKSPWFVGRKNPKEDKIFFRSSICCGMMEYHSRGRTGDHLVQWFLLPMFTGSDKECKCWKCWTCKCTEIIIH